MNYENTWSPPAMFWLIALSYVQTCCQDVSYEMLYLSKLSYIFPPRSTVIELFRNKSLTVKENRKSVTL